MALEQGTYRYYERLALLIQQHQECKRRGNALWEEITRQQIDFLWSDMPSGSGVDSGCKLDLERSNGEKILFRMDYHHMNNSGMYDGWTEHTVRVEGSLANRIRIHIGGRDRNGIKEYLHQLVWDVMDGLFGPVASVKLRDIAERIKAEHAGSIWVEISDEK